MIISCSALFIQSSARAQGSPCMCIGEDLPGMDSLIPYVDCGVRSGTCPVTACANCRYIGIQSLLGDSCCFTSFSFTSDSCFSICAVIGGNPTAYFPWNSSRDTSCGNDPLTLSAPPGHPLCGYNGCVCTCTGVPPPCLVCINPLVMKICGSFPLTLTVTGTTQSGCTGCTQSITIY